MPPDDQARSIPTPIMWTADQQAVNADPLSMSGATVNKNIAEHSFRLEQAVHVRTHIAAIGSQRKLPCLDVLPYAGFAKGCGSGGRWEGPGAAPVDKTIKTSTISEESIEEDRQPLIKILSSEASQAMATWASGKLMAGITWLT